MKSTSSILLSILAASFSPAYAAVTIWTDGAGDQAWSTPANWSAGTPISGSTVRIGTQPTGDQIGIDTDGVIVESLTFSNTLTGSVDITLFTPTQTLTTGGITNNSAFTASLSLPVIAGSNATWSGPVNFTSTVSLGSNQITLIGASTFSGSSLNFNIVNALTYGRFIGSGTAVATGVTINIGGTYTGVSGDTFDFTPGTFTGATLGSLPTLSSGLSWKTDQFLSTGTIAVVPEPSASLMLLIATSIGLTTRRVRPLRSRI